MYRIVLPILVLLSPTLLLAEDIPPYGHYNLRAILVAQKQADGSETYAINLKLIDEILADLHTHANDYPPRFATPDDLRRARSDAEVLAKLFEAWITDASFSDLLSRMARLYTFAHNFDIPGSVARTNVCYQRLLKSAPDNPATHYAYGSFLAHTGQLDDSVKHLTKAVDLNFPAALKPLSMAYLAQGKTDLAKSQLDKYLVEFPKDKRARTMMIGIRKDNVRVNSD